jgi:mannitol-1-phosphate 5-dehydrogenase
LERGFVGFGFGPIQGGLFVSEAYLSGNFSRLVVAEIDECLVAGVRDNGGCYCVNVAGANGIDVQRIAGVELYNPNMDADRAQLEEALSRASEIATCLPSVRFYESGEGGVASMIARTVEREADRPRIIYAAENDNHAARILREAVSGRMIGAIPEGVEIVNTVIGKMSRVVSDAGEIEELGLEPIAPGVGRAFLVEEFNRILIERVKGGQYKRGIEVFVEKDDLLPFEEAKLYGHNAIHAVLAYLGAARGYVSMTEIKGDAKVMAIGRRAFGDESGAALVRKYGNLNDELFTEAGYRAYAEDLLLRMTNPYLSDTVARAGRDVRRKLGYHDRIFGTMDLAFSQGIEPVNMAIGAIAAVGMLVMNESEGSGNIAAIVSGLSDGDIERILHQIWGESAGEYAGRIKQCVCGARGRFVEFAK